MPGTADDREAIAALVHEYATRLDLGDLDGVAALFADSTYRTARRPDPLRGAEAVRRVYDDVILYDDGRPRTRHVISNLVVEVESAEQASSRCYFTVLQASAGRLAPILAGRYHDRFVKRDGAWRFADRLILPDLIGDLSRHMRAPTPRSPGSPRS